MKKVFTPQQQQQPSEVRQSLPLQQQKTWAAVAIGGAGLVTSVVGGAQQAKAAKNAANAGSAQVNITELDERARELAKRNLADSAALEAQFNPEVANLRRAATESLLSYTQPDTARDTLRGALYSDFTSNNQPLARSSLLDSAIAKAGSDLALGGQLSTSARNEATRRAGATASTVGGGALGLGRDLSARDLGLSSMALEQQRLATASQLGGQDQAVLQAQNAALQQQMAQRASTAALISDLQGQTFNERLGLANFGQSIARPETGLTGSSLVDLTIGNTNATNAAAANAAAIRAQQGANSMAFGGQLLGLAGGLYANRTAKAAPVNNGVTTPNGYFASGDSGGYDDPNILGTYYYTPPKK
jgi:hypothetical protein